MIATNVASTKKHFFMVATLVATMKHDKIENLQPDAALKQVLLNEFARTGMACSCKAASNKMFRLKNEIITHTRCIKAVYFIKIFHFKHYPFIYKRLLLKGAILAFRNKFNV
jgi:hypothetical protein